MKITDFREVIRLANSRLSRLSLVYIRVTCVQEFDDYVQSTIPNDDLCKPIKRAFSEYWVRNNHDDVLSKELKEIYDDKGYVDIEEDEITPAASVAAYNEVNDNES